MPAIAPRRAHRRHERIERHVGLKRRRREAADQVEDEVAAVPHPVLDVVAEDPEEEHVADDVGPAGVHKHRGEDLQELPLPGRTDREVRGRGVDAEAQLMPEAGGDEAVVEEELVPLAADAQVADLDDLGGAQREHVDKDGDVDRDQRPVHVRRRAAAGEVGDRDHGSIVG